MKTYNITVTSKNKNSLTTFLIFLEKFCKFKFSYIKTKFIKKNKKRVFTLLKSPHVNKKAQEQFGIQIFSQQIIITTNTKFKFLIFVKRLKMFLFSDINVKLTTFTFLQTHKFLLETIFNPKNYINLNSTKKAKTKIYLKRLKNKIKPKTQELLKIFEFYGKLKNMFG